MAVIHARQALLTGGWAKNVRIGIEGGHIATLETDTAPAAGEERHDTVVAGMPNLHSHAFQRHNIALQLVLAGRFESQS